MFHLTKAAGLEDALYRGEWHEGRREGSGTQLFPNGYIYSGAWKANQAHGFGKLRYTDGCFYEGEFKNNRITQGTVKFPNGTFYVGSFLNDDKVKERFLEGTITFSNGDTLKGIWFGGNLKSGTFMTRDGKISQIGGSSVFVSTDVDDSTRGKLINPGSSEIYEGGLDKQAYNGKGFLFSSFPHYERLEYKKGKLDGKYGCNYISGGYCYEGYYKNGERVGDWTYLTVKGYQFTGEPSFTNGLVTFPFISKDYFKGKTETRFHNIILSNGVFNYVDEKDQMRQKKVENIKALSDIEEIKFRKLDFEATMKRIEGQNKHDEPVLSGHHTYVYEDGSTFTGNFNLDFIFIHKKDLPKCFTPAKNGLTSHPKKNFSEQKTEGKLIQKSSNNILKFDGKIEKGLMQGPVKITYSDNKTFEGNMVDGKREGAGTLKIDNRSFSGNFEHDELQGRACITENGQNIFVNFEKGVLDESKATIKSPVGTEYTGQIKGFKKHGLGDLTFTNGYSLSAEFKEDKIDTSNAPAKLTSPSGDVFSCDASVVETKGLTLLNCNDGSHVFVVRNNSGELKQAN